MPLASYSIRYAGRLSAGHGLRDLILRFVKAPLCNERPDAAGQRLQDFLFTHIHCLLSFPKRLYGITNRVGTL